MDILWRVLVAAVFIALVLWGGRWLSRRTERFADELATHLGLTRSDDLRLGLEGRVRGYLVSLTPLYDNFFVRDWKVHVAVPELEGVSDGATRRALRKALEGRHLLMSTWSVQQGALTATWPHGGKVEDFAAGIGEMIDAAERLREAGPAAAGSLSLTSDVEDEGQQGRLSEA